MKILAFGTCRVLQLFDSVVNNNTFLDVLQSLNYGNLGGRNVVSFSNKPSLFSERDKKFLTS